MNRLAPRNLVTSKHNSTGDKPCCTACAAAASTPETPASIARFDDPAAASLGFVSTAADSGLPWKWILVGAAGLLGGWWLWRNVLSGSKDKRLMIKRAKQRYRKQLARIKAAA